jgi:hypothetical protein
MVDISSNLPAAGAHLRTWLCRFGQTQPIAAREVGAMGGSKTIAIALMLIGLALTGKSAAAQTVPPPTVSPDPLTDVPPTPPNQSPFPFFNNYSWRSFIALNWPALAGPSNRGQPDRNKPFGDASGPRVWTTWKSQIEIFQPGGTKPSDWTSYAGKNPCGQGFSNDVVTLSAFTAFGDFNQAIFSLSSVGNPLVAQNQTYVRYEVRVNQPEFNSIVQHGWYIAAKLPTPQTAVPFDTGATEVKTAWRILTDRDSPTIRSRYYVVPNAQVFDVASSKCVKADIGLVGFHIVTKTPDRPQWIWSTFEQIDNVPGLTTEPRPIAGVPFSFNDPNKPQTLDPATRPQAISPTNPPVVNPTPMQAVRKEKILEDTMTMNRSYWNLPEIKGTVWQNYMLIMTQWPTQISPEKPTNDGAPFPSGGSEIANTTMETYFQFDGGSCMACHQISNSAGRDFVMFVTMDAFRPSVPAPADLFSAKLAGGKLFQTKPSALAADPMVKSLVQFFNSAQVKQ